MIFELIADKNKRESFVYRNAFELLDSIRTTSYTTEDKPALEYSIQKNVPSYNYLTVRFQDNRTKTKGVFKVYRIYYSIEYRLHAMDGTDICKNTDDKDTLDKYINKVLADIVKHQRQIVLDRQNKIKPNMDSIEQLLEEVEN